MSDWKPFASAPFGLEALFFRPGYFCVSTRLEGHYLEMEDTWLMGLPPTHWHTIEPPAAKEAGK